MIAQPQYKRTCRVIAQNQSASRVQDFLYAVKKVLRVRIVMKAVGPDNRVETVFRITLSMAHWYASFIS